MLVPVDSVAWLLNLRADDVEYNPFAPFTARWEPKGVHLFIDTSRVVCRVQTVLEAAGSTASVWGVRTSGCGRNADGAFV